MSRHILYAAVIALFMNVGFVPFGLSPLASAQTGSAAYDGEYKPTSSTGMALTARAKCNNSMTILRIANGVAKMTWLGLMEGPVGPDGTVNIASNGSKLDGKISKGVFEGKVSTASCIYTVTLAKS